MPRSCLLVVLAAWTVLSVAPSARCQAGGDADADARAHAARRAVGIAAANAIHKWVEGFVSGKIVPNGPVFLAKSSEQEYIRIAVLGGVLVAPRRRKQTTHFSLLHRLVGVAEKFQSKEVAEAFLALSASGYSRDLYSPHTIMVRDVGHFALRRNSNPTIWDHILGVATGRVDDSAVPSLDGIEVQVEVDGSPDDRREELTETARIMRRVAAVRLLGMNGNSVFRIGLEKCLADEDSRIRFAAAESFAQVRDLKFLYTLTRKVADEKHPLVVMALLSAIERTLKKYRNKVSIGRGMNTVRSLLPVLGHKGWRNDMTIVRMVRDYPVKPAVPVLISSMRAAQAQIDPILKILNKDASPVLADEIYQTLRQITGALLPPDPNKWQKFWNDEKKQLQLVAPYRKRRAARGNTKGTFFGIPVVGREVVFVIDTSGSMREPIRGSTGTRKPKDPKAPEVVTRLDAAKEQTLNAVQGIPDATRFHLVTFASGVRVWNQKPVKAGAVGFRGLTEALGRVRSNGGTNVYAALLHVLGAAQLRYGQQIKNDVEEVFLLSDGEPSVGVVKDPDAILAMVREINRYQKIRINTVFTGTGKGADFMRALAAQNHGVFVQR